MTKNRFDSEIGGRSFEGSSLKEFDVPDESGYQEPKPVMQQLDENGIREFQKRMNQINNGFSQDDMEFEKEVRAAREAKKTGKERLNDGAKRRIEMLIGMTRLTREVDIDGNTYLLRTLKSKDMRAALFAASEYDGTIQSPYEIRKQLLGRSLIQVAGIDIEQFIGSDQLEHKFLFIDELDESLLTRLYDEYVILAKESKEKYTIKNQDEMNEVAEDLKK